MDKNYNGLTPAETERLAILNEECAEVQQIISKILRHGYESYHPDDKKKTSNRVLLEKELGDLSLAISVLLKEEDVLPQNVAGFKVEKSKKINKYLHHNEVENPFTKTS